MKIKLNGEEKDIEGGLNIAGLLTILGLKKETVAIEQNGEIIRKPDYRNAVLKENDIVEIVHFVGGGQVV